MTRDHSSTVQQRRVQGAILSSWSIFTTVTLTDMVYNEEQKAFEVFYSRSLKGQQNAVGPPGLKGGDGDPEEPN